MKILILTSSNPARIKELEPSLIISNNPASARYLQENKVPCKLIDNDLSIKEELDKINPGLIILADYNKIIKSPELLKTYKDKIINIHLSYLPEFPGYKAHEQAWKSKAKTSGYTLHRIVKEVDKGEILKQERIDIHDCKTAEEVKDRLSKAAYKGLKELIATLKIPSF
ncbi:hypothetical protein CO038_04335 [Candidatus Pacearchaeota archaeon CG_4_9_14_0_2_um_filter_39_13]|nr:hypothetical protein [Candidatus Pacearchaeota archaeon]OIO42742.1 MAG: hypothetical protein AUJ64_03645 [Candidatus Pacearchaeota archaeon CG1_02_39_14]PJC44297.1 MAG: hypothetical protein CO038_04335 [Candidatus Pacearchaeota archaeon CG_4_9_14_0_2_um_filter_39_13]